MPTTSVRSALSLLTQLFAVVLLAGCQRPLIRVDIATEASSALVAARAVTPAVAPKPVHVTLTPIQPSNPTVQAAQAPAPAAVPPERLVIPAINLDAPVVLAGWTKDAAGNPVWLTPEREVGFLQGSALPGHAGNTVLSGHHNMGGKAFERLHEVSAGAAIQLLAGGVVYRYVVDDAFILPERGVSEEQRLQNARWIGPTNDERLTLVTCWPANDNSHRVIVVARPGGE